MSKQRDLALAEWHARTGEIVERVIHEADYAMAHPWNHPHGVGKLPYCCQDGMFDIMDEEGEYQEYTALNGNEDDETILIADIWCLVLARTKDAKYLPLMEQFLMVNVEGL